MEKQGRVMPVAKRFDFKVLRLRAVFLFSMNLCPVNGNFSLIRQNMPHRWDTLNYLINKYLNGPVCLARIVL